MVKIKKPKKELLVVGALVLLAATIGGIYYLQNRSDSAKLPNPVPDSNEAVNFSPPTEEEKQAAVDNKNAILEQEERIKNQPSPQPGAKAAIKPVINFAEQIGDKIEVGSYVPGIFEDGGNCTANFTRNANTVTKKVIAQKEGNATYCPLLTAQSNEFTSKGEWSVVVHYDSPNAKGTSEAVKFEVK